MCFSRPLQDDDNSGKMDSEELLDVIRALFPHLTRQERLQVVKEMTMEIKCFSQVLLATFDFSPPASHLLMSPLFRRRSLLRASKSSTATIKSSRRPRPRRGSHCSLAAARSLAWASRGGAERVPQVKSSQQAIRQAWRRGRGIPCGRCRRRR